MTADDRALIQHLFTLATEILEDAHPAATAGQSLKRRRALYAQNAAILQNAARDLDASAQTILAILNKNLRVP